MKEIYKCHLCNYVADKRHISCILSHLHDKHNIKRGTREHGPSIKFTNYVNKYIGNPLCACGCGKLVFIDSKNMQFHLFADGCHSRGRFSNPCCVEFYLFRGFDEKYAIKTISKIQSKEFSDENRKRYSIINSGDNNPSSLKSLIKRYGEMGAKRYLKKKARPGPLNPFYGHKHTEETKKICAMASASCPRVSSLQIKLYKMLNKSSIKHYEEKETGSDKECMVGRWPFDCVIPIHDTKLLIDCQGEYWHSLPEVKKRDRRKAYFVKHHTDFPFKKLYEREFKNMDKIETKVMRWINEIKNHHKNK
jgi:hypothetical protein